LKPNSPTRIELVSRRNFLRLGTGAFVTVGLACNMPGCTMLPDPETETRIRVPEGFEPRIVARSGHRTCDGSDYIWHPSPDGGACFDAGDGGWVYVSNRETLSAGGVGALRFDANGTIIDSYEILGEGRMNCSGGPTPWGSWLSCEEVSGGRVWECDPFNRWPAVARERLGLFEHEAACVDPLSRQIYLTEDRRSGRLYRFTPDDAMAGPAPDLDAGILEVAIVSGGTVSWAEIPDPSGLSMPLRHQVENSTGFAGGEGIDIFDRYLRFTTKYDNRIWEINLADDSIRVLHRLEGLMHDVDDLTHTPTGGYLVAEDGSQMRILYFAGEAAAPVLLAQLPEHRESEITGLAFDPGGTRLYFSSQRGSTGGDQHGLSFEVRGDFSSLGPGMAMQEWILDHDQIGRYC